MSPKQNSLLQTLPSVDSLLQHEEVQQWLDGVARSVVVASLRVSVDNVRREILEGRITEAVDVEELLAGAESEIVRRSTPSLRRVVNATGIVLHTGLGRAPLCDAAIEAIAEGASGYSNLEYDLSTGKRGTRTSHIVEKLVAATGAEHATVVNNNAAATLLILKILAADREVIVSRGQLIEIGGSFRLPDIMAASGAELHEVGTTNRTRIGDYENAINERTAVLLRVHTSNYRVVGFTEEVAAAEMAALAHRRGLLAVDDLGSGALIPPPTPSTSHEPIVADSIAAGIDLVCFSGDKLLGGPQCGIIVGRRNLIERIESDPLMRTYRVGKLTLLALEATIGCYVDEDEALESIPTLSMLQATPEVLTRRAQQLSEMLSESIPQERFLICSGSGFAGGGSMPQEELESVVLQWRPACAPPEAMAAAMRDADVPVIVSIRDGAVNMDVRTIRDMDLECVVSAVTGAVWDASGCPEDDPETGGD